MDRLPREVCDEIGRLCSGDKSSRPSLAAVSRQWQVIIEQQTFQSLSLKNTDLDSFGAIFERHRHRRRFLDYIRYNIVLPEYSDRARFQFEREPDRQANNEVFSTAIHGLLRILSPWDECKEGTIKLVIGNFASPTDPPKCICPQPAMIDVGAEEGVNQEMRGRRCRYSYLSLLRPDELPLVPAIRIFDFQPGERRASYRVAFDIVAKLPNVLDIFWCIEDAEKRYPALRRANRHALAEAIPSLLSKASELVNIHISIPDGYPYWNPDWHPADLRVSPTSSDPLSSAMREATARFVNLKSLGLIGTFDSSLFWPSPSNAIVPPFWQNLERLFVHFSIQRPSGGWYVRARDPNRSPFPPSTSSMTEMPPGYGYSEQEDITAALQFSYYKDCVLSGYRMSDINVEDEEIAVPDEGSIVPLLEAFARACIQMPNIQSAWIETMPPVPSNDLRLRVIHAASWGVSYTAPTSRPARNLKTIDRAFSEDSEQRRLFWDVGNWRPTHALRELFRTIGRERYGDTLVEKFVDNYTAVATNLDPDWRAGPKEGEKGIGGGSDFETGHGHDIGEGEGSTENVVSAEDVEMS